MSGYWLVVGSPQNWRTAFEHKNIWGLRQTQVHLWDRLEERDTLLFYVTSPVSGAVGHGTVRMKFRQSQPLWPEEITESKVIWPLRFEFNVEYCLPSDRWQTSKVTSPELFPRGGFQALSPSTAQQLVSKLAPSPKKYHVTVPAPTPVEEIVPSDARESRQDELVMPSHDGLKHRLVEIGRLQGYLADDEYVFDTGRLDVVWRRVERSVPTYVFEVQVGGDVYHALGKLKHAFDLWNSHIFIVAPQEDRNRVESLLSGTFHEINHRIKFIELDKVEELYKRKRAYLDFEKELGI